MKTLVWITLTVILMIIASELVVPTRNVDPKLPPVPTDVFIDEFVKYAQDDMASYIDGHKSKYGQYLDTYVNPTKYGKLPLHSLHRLKLCISNNVGHTFMDSLLPRIPSCITEFNRTNNNDSATFVYLITYYKHK